MYRHSEYPSLIRRATEHGCHVFFNAPHDKHPCFVDTGLFHGPERPPC